MVFSEMLTEEEQQEVAKEAQKRKLTSRPIRSQKTIGEVLKSKKKYEKGSMQYQLITRKLAIFIASSNAPNSLVENEEFRSLIQTLDYRYDVPPRAQIGHEIDQILLELKGNFQSYLVKAQKVNICADVWTKKGMTSDPHICG